MEGNNSEPVPLTTEERKSLMEEREVTPCVKNAPSDIVAPSGSENVILL